MTEENRHQIAGDLRTAITRRGLDPISHTASNAGTSLANQARLLTTLSGRPAMSAFATLAANVWVPEIGPDDASPQLGR